MQPCGKLRHDTAEFAVREFLGDFFVKHALKAVFVDDGDGAVIAGAFYG